MLENNTTLTLEEVKAYLRVGYDEDDAEISQLIEVANAYIDSCVGKAYKKRANYGSDEDYKKGLNLSALIQKKIIKDMYDERGQTVSNNTKNSNIVITILDTLSNVGA